jgi:hypothetical protein
MFVKLAQFRALGSSRAPSAPRVAHSNDNQPCPRPFGAPRRTQRRILVCRWQPAVGGGRLECRWSIELVESSPTDEPQRRRTIGPPGHSMESPKEVDNGHHPRGQVRPRSRVPLVRTRSFSARELHLAPFHQSLRAAHDSSDCSSCGAIRREMFGAISGAPYVRTQAAS